MKYFSLCAAIILFLSPLALKAQDDNSIISFFPTADSMSEYPPMESELAIICQKKLDSRYVSFIGNKDDKRIFIAAITLKPIKDLAAELSVHVQFNGLVPNVGQISSWGFVYDRNNDGKIDYMALLGGAAAFKKDDITEDYPVRDQKLTQPQLELFVSHCKLIFNHFADDNFDGKIDALVHIDMDMRRDWVERKILIRSTKFDKHFDDVWAFRDHINEEPQPVEHSATSVPYHPLGKFSGEITNSMLEGQNAILKLLNRAAASCSVGKDFNKDE